MEKDITHLGDTQVFLKIRQELAGLGTPVLAYLVVVVVAALGLAAGLLALGQGLDNAVVVLGLAFVAAYAERGSITLRGHLTVSISLFPAIFAAVLFGPLAAMLVFGASGSQHRFPLGRTHCVTWQRGPSPVRWPRAPWRLFPCSLGGGLARRSLPLPPPPWSRNSSIRGFRFLHVLAEGIWPLDHRCQGLPAGDRCLAPVLQLGGCHPRPLVPRHLGVDTSSLLRACAGGPTVVPAVPRAATTCDRPAGRKRSASCREPLLCQGLIATLDARDQYTAGHSAAVAIYARDIARRMDLGEDYADLAHLCGLVHDIGKIGLPAGLLEKPGALTLDERRDMQRHSEIGERILANVDTYAEIAAVVRHHHERVDGQGYPDRLSGEQIPMLSRIIAVADAYNAMTSDRPYRDAMPSRVARLRLAQAVETQFDTAVVAAFEAILAGANEDYRMAQGQAFELVATSDRAPRVAESLVEGEAEAEAIPA